VKVLERKFIVVTISQEFGFEEDVFLKVNQAFEVAQPAYLSRMFCGFVAYFCPGGNTMRRVERFVEYVGSLKSGGSPSRDLRVGLSYGPVMVELGLFGRIKGILIPGPTVKEAMECENTPDLHRQKLHALRASIQTHTSPNGGPTTPAGNSGATKGPPSMN